MSRRFVSRVLLVAVALFVFACRGTTPKPTSVPDEGVAAPNDSPAGAAVMAEADHEQRESHDVSRVKPPGPVVFHLRWRNPDETLSELARFTQLSPAFVEHNMQLLVQEIVREMLRDKVQQKAFAEVVAMDAPIDVVVMLDLRSGPVPTPMMAMSLGLRSLSAARRASRGRTKRLADGIWRLGPEPKPWESNCAVAASAGRTPARLVCADDRRMLARMTPYMARTAPTLPNAKSDLHAEVRLRHVLDEYGSGWAKQIRGLKMLADEAKIGNARFDRAVDQIATALVEEVGALINDADAIVIDANLDPAKGVDIRFDLKFAGSQSWSVSTMVDLGKYAGPAPDMFWQLPAKSEALSYGRWGDGARLEALLVPLRDLLQGALEEEKIGNAADRRAIARLLRVPINKGADVVVANGHFAPNRAVASTPQSMMVDMVDATVGWHLIGVRQPPAKLRAWLEEAAAVYNRPGLKKLMKKELRSDAKHLPVVRVVRGPAQLGAASSMMEITVPGLDNPMGHPHARGKPKPIDLKGYLMLMPDGDRTWLGIATNKAGIVALMKGLKGNKPSATSVASRPGLARLKREKHVAVGVTHIEGLVNAMKPGLLFGANMAPSSGVGRPNPNDPLAQILHAISSMPNGGKTPIMFISDVTSGARPRVSGTLHVSRASLVDLGHVVTNALKAAAF